MHKHNTKRSRRQACRDGTPIYVGRVIVGSVGPDGVFFKRIQGSKHILRTPRAIAFDLATLDDAEAAGARRCEVLDVQSGHRYAADISLIRARGIRINRGGYGQQLALLVNEWSCDGKPQLVKAPPEGNPRQMGLGL